MFGCLGDFGIAERALPHRVFGTRAIFILLLTLRKLITRGFLYIYIIIVGLHYFTCAGNGLRLRHVVSSASRRRRPNRRKSARVITLFIMLPYRRVRLPRGLQHRR